MGHEHLSSGKSLTFGMIIIGQEKNQKLDQGSWRDVVIQVISWEKVRELIELGKRLIIQIN